RRVGSNAENHRQPAELVSASATDGMEIRSGRRAPGSYSRGRKTNCRMSDRRLRGERPRLWRRIWIGDPQWHVPAYRGQTGVIRGAGAIDCIAAGVRENQAPANRHEIDERE